MVLVGTYSRGGKDGEGVVVVDEIVSDGEGVGKGSGVVYSV
jgi:hypothetical protein